MSESQLIWEAYSSCSLVVVDVQPSYESFHKGLIDKLASHINNSSYDKIIWFFNGQELGYEEDEEMMESYVLENGIDEDIQFIEKQYGFLRDWIDNDVPYDRIVSVLKYMIENDISDSREIDSDYNNLGSISYPLFDLSVLQDLSKVHTAGGGCNECLLEIEIVLDSLNIPYNRLSPQLVY